MAVLKVDRERLDKLKAERQENMDKYNAMLEKIKRKTPGVAKLMQQFAEQKAATEILLDRFLTAKQVRLLSHILFYVIFNIFFYSILLYIFLYFRLFIST